MPGPISTNAQFNQVGHDNVLRDIEQLYLLVPQSTGDLGNQPINSSDMNDNGANRQNGLTRSRTAATVHYLGTLDLPIFGGSTSVAGNAAGTGAVDWQQIRTAAAQVAAANYSTIAGGYANAIAAAATTGAFVAGTFCSITGYSSVALGGGTVVNGIGAVGIGGDIVSPGVSTPSLALVTRAEGDGAIAIGSGQTLTTTGAIARGQNAVSFGGQSRCDAVQSLTVHGTVTRQVTYDYATTPTNPGIYNFAFGSTVTGASTFQRGLYIDSTYDGSAVTWGNPTGTKFGLFSSTLTNQALLSGAFCVNSGVTIGETATSRTLASISVFNTTLALGGIYLGRGERMFIHSSYGLFLNVATDSAIFNSGHTGQTGSWGSLTNSNVFNCDWPTAPGAISDSTLFNCRGSGGGQQLLGVADCFMFNTRWNTCGVNVSSSVFFNCGGGNAPTVALTTGFFYGCQAAADYALADVVFKCTAFNIKGKLKVAGAFGCNNATERTSATVNAALAAAGAGYVQAYAQSQSDLINQIRTALINNGICV